MLERARRIEAEFEALDSDVASLRDVISGQVRVGLIGTTARWLVPPLLTATGERYPEVSVVIRDATTSSLVLNLLSGSIDLAVLNLLPIPVLDGGQIVFLLAEGVLGRPLPLKLREKLTLLGLALVGTLMALAFWNDIRRIIEGLGR